MTLSRKPPPSAPPTAEEVLAERVAMTRARQSADRQLDDEIARLQREASAAGRRLGVVDAMERLRQERPQLVASYEAHMQQRRRRWP